MYATIDEDIGVKSNKIPLTTNACYKTASSQALGSGTESKMYATVDDHNTNIPLAANESSASQALGMESKMYDDDDLTTNASYGTTSSRALSKMYDGDDITTNASYGTAPSQPDRKTYDYVDNEVLKKSDVPLTANASYGTQTNKQALYEMYTSMESVDESDSI